MGKHMAQIDTCWLHALRTAKIRAKFQHVASIHKFKIHCNARIAFSYLCNKLEHNDT